MNQKQSLLSRLVFIGAGGHAKVLHALALAAGHEIIGICDPVLAHEGLATWRNVPVLGNDLILNKLCPDDVGIVNAVGHRVGQAKREELYKRIKAMGFYFPVLIHPTAWVADSAKLSEGVQITAGVIVQPDCRIGANTLINTKSSIDHDCDVGAHVHIAPGVTICGNVSIGEQTFIGSGATLIQGIRVGKRTVIGAGTTLIKNVDDNTKILAKTEFSISANMYIGQINHG